MANTHALSKMLPYSSHITPEIIKLKGGSYMMAFRLHGISYVGKDQELIDNRVNLINQSIMRMRAPTRYNIYIHTHAIKAEGSAHLADDFESNGFAQTLNQEYLDKVINARPILKNDYYITIIYRAYRKIGKVSAVKLTKKEIATHQKQAEEELGKIKDRLLSEFQDYDIEVLSCYDKVNSEGHVVTFSSTLQFLNQLVNFSGDEVPLMRAQISEYLPTATLSVGSNDYIKIERNGSSKFAAMISIVDYPVSTHAGMIQPFLEQSWQMIVSQVFVPIDKSEAVGWLKREFNRAQNTDEASESDLEDLLNAREGVQADNFVLGEYYWSAMLIADSIEELRQNLSDATTILSGCGFNVATNRLGKLHSYFAQLPGNLAYRLRDAKLSSENVSQMMPYLIQNHGKPKGNPWGSAVSMLRTVNDEIFYFSFHDGDKKADEIGKLSPGNTVISGKTGAGKTVLLSFLLAQAQRFNPRPKTIIFDMDLGSSVFVKAMNGKYSQIKIGLPTGFNPFHLENNPSNRAFMNELILAILSNDHHEITAKEINEIEVAISRTMNEPKHISGIEAFYNLLPDGDNSVKQRIKAWVHGEFSWVFKNPYDNFDLDADIIGIDYTEFLGNEKIRTPILMYLFHRIEMMLDGSPFIISLDEAWHPLQDEKFQKFIEKKERTIRKQNGVLILTTQNPDDFFEGVPSAIMGQVVTQIFLPNDNASREVYLKKVGMSIEEYELMRSMGTNSREFLVKHQGETTHCRLNLKGVKAVDVLSGSEARAKYADQLIREYGTSWLEQYYSTVKNLSFKDKETENEKNS